MTAFNFILDQQVSTVLADLDFNGNHVVAVSPGARLGVSGNHAFASKPGERSNGNFISNAGEVTTAKTSFPVSTFGGSVVSIKGDSNTVLNSGLMRTVGDARTDRHSA